MEAELIMMGLSSICSFLAAYTMHKIQKREKLEEERRKARDQENKQKEKAREQFELYLIRSNNAAIAICGSGETSAEGVPASKGGGEHCLSIKLSRKKSFQRKS